MGKRQSLQRELHNKALGVRSHPCPVSPVSPAPGMVCNAHSEFGREAAELGGWSSAPNKEFEKYFLFPSQQGIGQGKGGGPDVPGRSGRNMQHYRGEKDVPTFRGQ